MTESADMQLVFRLAGRGFVLSIGDVVEIREAVALGADIAPRDAAGEPLEVMDLRPRLELSLAAPCSSLLVLCGEAGPWALPVDGVDGIFPGVDFALESMPVLLQREPVGPFREVAIWREELLLVCHALQLEALGRGV